MNKRLISAFILIAYSAILIKLMVFKDLPLIKVGPLTLNFGGTQEGAGNFVPFKTILPYLLGEKGLLIAFINIVGNIILLVPIGFLVPFVYRNTTWKKSLALAIAAGFAIEGMQVLLHVGIFDIDDVILNALGVMIGYWSFDIVKKWVRSRKYKTITITAIIIIAATVAVLYAVYPKGQQPGNFVHDAEKDQHDSAAGFNNEAGDISPGGDPCNGTGGTGQIVSVGNNSITIRGRKGIREIVKLTDQTKISSSLGTAHQSDLKPGDRVTVIIDGSETATTVLICNGSSPGAEHVK